MKTKTILISFAILIIIIIAQFFYFKMKTSDLEQENLNLQEEKKVELKKVRDSAFFKIEELTAKSETKFDSIIKTNKIRYVPYEKLVYMYIDFDSAYSILSRTSYKKGRE